jgi:hypothetical protein
MIHPNWLSVEPSKPEFQMPLALVLLAIAVLGLGLALVHPWLGITATLCIVVWVSWRYFAWLQCDDCASFYYGGQLGSGLRATRPWTRHEFHTLARRVIWAGGLLMVIFLPLNHLERTATKNCAADCAKGGMAGETSFHRCQCVPKSS